jgi:hypothetical protein
LIERANGTWLGLELKHLSAVTDQFKCRSYDVLHLKQTLGTKLCAIMVYLHVPGANGISINRACQASSRQSNPFSEGRTQDQNLANSTSYSL